MCKLCGAVLSCRHCNNVVNKEYIAALFVTGSGKTAHVSRFDFSPRTQHESYMNKLSNFTIKFSGFAGGFSQQSVHAVWGLNGALVSLGMTVLLCCVE